ncbi:LacI family DNA-binding transcriptional regulator [Yinghuangia seranimata]|uniref:LacI family DNA-binding transcriptional regulator n=1 Tax=Yinghuangia seranimata TaxID=408067 RepID=UPI00248C19E0|nr:LacI family DNA-binding transcriptional regulator [Yinghuangia seranimata]MDI2131662.1 LacI family DNA-binding transcriptional regulator [Yinghuangia seranimata]
MTARLSDIATHAGVSEATVSRVLNGKPGVSAATRQSVLAALDLLGYERPTRLRRRSAGLVGLITPELDNPIFPAFAQVIERSLTQREFTAVLCTQTPGGTTEDDFTDLLLERGVVGIIYVSGMHADTTAGVERYAKVTGQGVPAVMINGYAEGVDAPFISCDDRLAMRLAVSHLVELGHQRIGLLSGPRRFTPVIRKIEGFTRAMADLAGVGESELLVENTLFSFEGGAAAARSLLDRGATALVCGSDLMALGAMDAARERGLAVPHDLSVVGFDDSPLMAYTCPPLTTIRQPVRDMGLAAVRALLDELNGIPAPRSEFVYRPELVVRGSTGAVPRPAAG